jgi:hypothetical protein
MRGHREILFFSNTGNIDNIEFSFNGRSIPLSTSHKHLGVILSQNAKWNEHLENMTQIVATQV